MTNEFKGFSLFNDIEDTSLRQRNRAVVMANIAESNSRSSRITPKGMGLIIGYFGCIPENERKAVHDQFIISMKERNFEQQPA